MKVCLVLPKYSISLNNPCCYPLGFQYVSSEVKSVWPDTKVLNFNLWDYDLFEEFKGQDLILMTGGEEFLPAIKGISQIARHMGISTCLGGSLATFRPKEMKYLVDVVYEGEFGRKFPIDSLPWPDYEGFGIEEYHKRHTVRYMGILASRGCPYSCIFCASVCGYRERDLKGVEEEIDYYIKKYRIEYLTFNDNTLNVTKPRFMNICRMMDGKGLAWSAAVRADVFDEEMANAFQNSGGHTLVVGIESFRQERLDKMNKRLDVEQLRNTLDLLNAHKIFYYGNVILGINGESMGDIISEVSELPREYNVYPILAQPFPGTKVSSTLNQDQRDSLNKIFTEYAQAGGLEMLNIR